MFTSKCVLHVLPVKECYMFTSHARCALGLPQKVYYMFTSKGVLREASVVKPTISLK